MGLLVAQMVGRVMTKHLRTALSGLLLGMIVGGSIMQFVTIRERALLASRAHELEITAARWKHETLKLRDELGAINQRAQQGAYIETVNLAIIHSPVPKVDVQAALEPYTESMLGMNLNTIKPQVVYNLFEGRIVTIGASLYKVRVKTLLLAPTTVLMIEIAPVSSSPQRT